MWLGVGEVVALLGISGGEGLLVGAEGIVAETLDWGGKSLKEGSSTGAVWSADGTVFS